MKNNKTMRLALVLILLVAITLSVISGTLAKYVEEVKGTDTARVAKFEYTATAGGTELTKDSVATINLFNTVDDAQVFDPAGHNLNTEKLVAPGTCGHFDVIVTNKSEVAIKAAFTVEETNANSVPIVYYITDGSTTKYYSDVVTTQTAVAVGGDIATALGLQASDVVTIEGNLAAMATAMTQADGTELAATNKSTFTTKTYTLGWFWAFGDATHHEDDATDTALGKTGTDTVKVDIGVTFTQVD